MEITTVRFLIILIPILSIGCSNANVTVTGLSGAGKTLQAVPGFDTGGPVSSVTNGNFTVKGKVDSLKTSIVVNGSFIVTGEVVR